MIATRKMQNAKGQTVKATAKGKGEPPIVEREPENAKAKRRKAAGREVTLILTGHRRS
jgi:hypothetical protein